MNNNLEKITSAKSYLGFGKSYLDCAKFLMDGLEKEELDLSHDSPVYQLLGQAFELIFKAVIITDGKSAEDLKKMGHGLLRLATKAEQVPGSSLTIKKINLAQKDYWRKIAVDDQNRSKKTTPEDFQAVIHFQTNNEIETRLPNFLSTLGDLNGLYDKPFYTRYFTHGPKRIPTYEALFVSAVIAHEFAKDTCTNYSKAKDI